MLNSYKKQFDKFDLKCEVHIIVIYQLENYSHQLYFKKPAEVSLTYILWKVFMFFFRKLFDIDLK
jgi:hypothetical protein